MRYIEHAGHANEGLSASRNAGIAASAGEFVALIDADDAWLPRKLAEQVALMEADPGLGILLVPLGALSLVIALSLVVVQLFKA